MQKSLVKSLTLAKQSKAKLVHKEPQLRVIEVLNILARLAYEITKKTN